MIYEVTIGQTNSYLHERIRTTNRFDPLYVQIFNKVQEDKFFQQQKEYKLDELGQLWSKEILYVLDGGEIWSNILTEFHRAPYSTHPGYQ